MASQETESIISDMTKSRDQAVMQLHKLDVENRQLRIDSMNDEAKIVKLEKSLESTRQDKDNLECDRRGLMATIGIFGLLIVVLSFSFLVVFFG